MKAYITLLSNANYLPGVQVLARSLKAVGARYPLVCALSVAVPEAVQAQLEDEGIACLRLSRAAVAREVNPTGKGFSHWNYSFDKLLIWEQTQYEKLVFLDSDMLVLRNIDHLFDCPPFSAVSADVSYPGNEGWTGGLNSGLMVISPSPQMAQTLLQSVPAVVAEAQAQHQLVGDQDVIKRVLQAWPNRPELHLDEGYNLFADHLTYYIRHLGYAYGRKAQGKPIYVVHFIGKAKPWTKKTWRMWAWIGKMCLHNPYYALAYRQFRALMK